MKSTVLKAHQFEQIKKEPDELRFFSSLSGGLHGTKKETGPRLYNENVFMKEDYYDHIGSQPR